MRLVTNGYPKPIMDPPRVQLATRSLAYIHPASMTYSAYSVNLDSVSVSVSVRARVCVCVCRAPQDHRRAWDSGRDELSRSKPVTREIHEGGTLGH